MRYQVPQFIDRDIKIMGPLNFKQFIFFGTGIFICFIIYFVIAPKSFILFLILSTIVMLTIMFLTFGKYNGMSLTKIVGNMVVFSISGRTYLWKKKAITPELLIPIKEKQETKEKVFMPKKQDKSQLESLSRKIEIGET